jgi:hypothetical protein
MGWTGHVTRGGQQRGVEFLERRTYGKRQFGRPRYRWDIPIKLIFKK